MKRLTYLTFALAGVAACAAAVWVVEAVAIHGYLSEATPVPHDLPGVEEQEALVAFLPPLDPRIADARNIQAVCLLLGGFAAAGVVYCVWWRRTLSFLVEFAGGSVVFRKGRIGGEVVEEFRQCVNEAGVAQGAIWGRSFGHRTRLGCSRSIPKNVQQRLRNIWAQTNHARVGLARR